VEGLGTASSRAPSLGELLSWVAAESALMRRDVPDKIHAQHGDRDEWGRLPADAPGGLPFARAFEAYVCRDLDSTRPVVRALWRMRREAAPGNGRQMFRVCLALLQGDEPAAIRQRMHLTEFAFATAALHGLATLRTKAEDAERLHEQNHRAA